MATSYILSFYLKDLDKPAAQNDRTRGQRIPPDIVLSSASHRAKRHPRCNSQEIMQLPPSFTLQDTRDSTKITQFMVKIATNMSHLGFFHVPHSGR